MVWVFERPVKSKKLLVIQDYLTKQLKDKEASFLFVKLLSLEDFLRTSNFKTPSEIRDSVFYDEARTKPVFDIQQSQKLIKLMKQSGGGSEEARVFDHGIRLLISYIRERMPNIVVNLSDVAYPYLTFLRSLEKSSVIGPWIEIAKESTVQLGTTAIVTADTIAAEVGGPFGEAVIAIPAAIAGMGVIVTHLASDELGDALIASFLILPFVGPILYKSAMSFGKIANKVSSRKSDIVETSRSLLGDTIADNIHIAIPEPKIRGGKELSSRKHRIQKWRMKTQRK